MPPRERARFQGYFGALFAISSTVGPVLGAYLTEHLGWRSVFAVNIPLGVLAALLAWRIPQQPIERSGRFQADVPGTLLFTLGAASLLFALTSAGHRFAWNSLALAGLLTLAAFCAAALLWWERRAPDPVIPVRLLAKPVVLRSNAVVICFAAALFSTVLYLPLYLQLGRGVGVGESGLLLLPITLSIALSSTLTGRLVARSGRLKPFPIIGLSVSSSAFLILAAIVGSSSTAVVLALTVVAAAGLGTVMSVTQIVVQNSAGREALGSATASVSVCRSLGGALGVALTGALLFAALAKGDALLTSILPQLAQTGGAALASLLPAERAALVAHLDSAFQLVFLSIAGITALGAAIAATVPGTKL